MGPSVPSRALMGPHGLLQALLGSPGLSRAVVGLHSSCRCVQAPLCCQTAPLAAARLVSATSRSRGDQGEQRGCAPAWPAAEGRASAAPPPPRPACRARALPASASRTCAAWVSALAALCAASATFCAACCSLLAALPVWSPAAFFGTSGGHLKSRSQEIVLPAGCADSSCG